MAVNDKVDKKKGAIFRMEEVDGKLFRVMYFKNDKGGLTRSKFIREVTRKAKKPKGKRGRPLKSLSRSTINTKLINENRAQIITNARQINTTRQPQRQQIPQRQQAPQRQPRASDKYVKPSGATQSIINEWTNRSKKR